MTDYVVYHNPARMGYSARNGNALRAYTRKTPKGITGDRVWLITREDTLCKGRPCMYFLRGTFLVSDVGDSDHPDFPTVMSGTDETMCDPMLVLNHELWFPSFRQEQGNFALGFQRIHNPAALAGLRALLLTHVQQV